MLSQPSLAKPTRSPDRHTQAFHTMASQAEAADRPRHLRPRAHPPRRGRWEGGTERRRDGAWGARGHQGGRERGSEGARGTRGHEAARDRGSEGAKHAVLTVARFPARRPLRPTAAHCDRQVDRLGPSAARPVDGRAPPLSALGRTTRRLPRGEPSSEAPRAAPSGKSIVA